MPVRQMESGDSKANLILCSELLANVQVQQMISPQTHVSESFVFAHCAGEPSPSVSIQPAVSGVE
eukprot:2605745-Rhodomonas_salina.1